MGRMNWNRILFGGLLSGLVINTGEYLLHRIVLRQDWADLMKKFKDPPTPLSGEFAVLTVSGLLMGVLTLWLYAAIRPRIGPGPKTALTAAVVVWLPAYFLGLMAPFMLGIFPARMIFLSMAGGLVELMAGALLGGLLYADADGELKPASGAP